MGVSGPAQNITGTTEVLSMKSGKPQAKAVDILLASDRHTALVNPSMC